MTFITPPVLWRREGGRAARVGRDSGIAVGAAPPTSPVDEEEELPFRENRLWMALLICPPVEEDPFFLPVLLLPAAPSLVLVLALALVPVPFLGLPLALLALVFFALSTIPACSVPSKNIPLRPSWPSTMCRWSVQLSIQ